MSSDALVVVVALGILVSACERGRQMDHVMVLMDASYGITYTNMIQC